MKQIKTLRARLALWQTALILAFLAAFGGFVFFTLSRSLHTAVDDALRLSAEQVLASLREEDGSLHLLAADNSADLVEFNVFTQRGLTLVVLSQNGDVLQAIGPLSLDSLPVFQPLSQPGFQTVPETNEVDPMRFYTLPVIEGDQVVGWVLTMQSLGNAEESLDRLRTALIVGSSLLSLLAGFAGYFLAGRALAPIDKITNTA